MKVSKYFVSSRTSAFGWSWNHDCRKNSDQTSCASVAVVSPCLNHLLSFKTRSRYRKSNISLLFITSFICFIIRRICLFETMLKIIFSILLTWIFHSCLILTVQSDSTTINLVQLKTATIVAMNLYNCSTNRTESQNIIRVTDSLSHSDMEPCNDSCCTRYDLVFES